MTVPTIPDLPTPPQPADDKPTFNSRMFAWIVAILDWTTAVNAVSSAMNSLYTTITGLLSSLSASEANAAASAAASSNSAAAAAASAGAAAWVSGQTYAQFALARSLVDYLVYRRFSASGSGTVDPSSDPTNWEPVAGLGDFWGRSDLITPNLMVYTESFDDPSGWSQNAAVPNTVTANTTAAPDGTSTADALTISAGGWLVQSLTLDVVPGDQVTWSVYAKSSTAIGVGWGGTTPAGPASYFIEPVGGGWFRHWVTKTSSVTASSGNFQAIINGPASGTATWTIWGAQLVRGGRPGVYVPRLTSSGWGVAQLVARRSYDVDTTNGALAVNMPANGGPGDWVRLCDKARTCRAKPLTLQRNGSKFFGAGEDWIMDLDGETAVFGTDTTKGWVRA